MPASDLTISREAISLDLVVKVASEDLRVTVGRDVVKDMKKAHDVLNSLFAGGERIYGLNTGLGPLRNQSVSPSVVEDYQEQIIYSHSGGLGEPLPTEDVRAVMFARLIGLTRGRSGANPEVATALGALINERVHPEILATGSLGASDLTVLAPVAAVIAGKGWAEHGGARVAGAEALQRAKLPALTLGPKEALSLISANSYSIGVGALTLAECAQALRLADISAALTMEAQNANVSPFDPEISAVRPFPYEGVVAQHIRRLVAGSKLTAKSEDRNLQDQISIRTIPQVHGAARSQLTATARIVSAELNGSGDNPLISSTTGRAISNGNFHPMELALAFESLRLAIAHVGIMAERRIAGLVARHRALRPIEDEVRGHAWRDRFTVPVLIGNAVASLAAELKQLATPVTLGVPPIGGDVEDHSTFAPKAVELTRKAADKLTLILSVELMLSASLLREIGDDRLGEGTELFNAIARQVIDNADPDEQAGRVAELLRQTLLNFVDNTIDMTDHPKASANSNTSSNEENGDGHEHVDAESDISHQGHPSQTQSWSVIAG